MAEGSCVDRLHCILISKPSPTGISGGSIVARTRIGAIGHLASGPRPSDIMKFCGGWTSHPRFIRNFQNGSFLIGSADALPSSLASCSIRRVHVVHQPVGHRGRRRLCALRIRPSASRCLGLRFDVARHDAGRNTFADPLVLCRHAARACSESRRRDVERSIITRAEGDHQFSVWIRVSQSRLLIRIKPASARKVARIFGDIRRKIVSPEDSIYSRRLRQSGSPSRSKSAPGVWKRVVVALFNSTMASSTS
jgi:hypothetical protein